MISTTLSTSKYRVVVVNDHGTCTILIEKITINCTCPGKQTICWSISAQCIHIMSSMLTCDDERPVFFERTGVHQFINILSGHTVTTGIPFGDSFRTILIQRIGMPHVHLFEVRTDKVRIEFFTGSRFSASNLSLLDKDNRIPLAHNITCNHRYFSDDAVTIRGYDMFHFHGFNDSQCLPGSYLIVDGHVNGNNRALYWRTHANGSIRTGHFNRFKHFVFLGLFCLNFCIMIKKCQRIAGIDLRACEP